MIETILNGQAQGGDGSVGARLLQHNMDVNCLRPWVGRDGRSYIVQNAINPQTGTMEARSVPLNNAVATLRKDEWLQVDDTVVRSVRDRLRLVADIRGAGLEYRINGMGKTVLETSVMTKAGRATLSMDPARIGEGDRPEFDSRFLPLPICHYDFYFNMREILVSRNGANPLDTVMVEEAGVAVAEELEQLTLGTLPSYSYGGGTVYGLLNFPFRHTIGLSDPTDVDWTGEDLVTNILSMRSMSTNARRYGPWVLYVSPNWAAYLDKDYSATKGERTIRRRILDIEGISDIRQLDYMSGFQMLMVQMTAQNIRMVIGLDLTTIQWDTIGGMRQNFKVMALMVPQLRVDADGNSGVVHGQVI